MATSDGMKMTEEAAKYQQRYMTALHSMQAGVAMMEQYEPGETSPKHLRVGVNSALISAHAIVDLLIEKGVITLEDYWRHLALAAEVEAKDYKKRVSNRLGGIDITLV